MRKLTLVEPSDIETEDQHNITKLVAQRSPFWADYMASHPFALAKVYDAMCGWLVASFPDEFELDI